jgi:hypothetical protein
MATAGVVGNIDRLLGAAETVLGARRLGRDGRAEADRSAFTVLMSLMLVVYIFFALYSFYNKHIPSPCPNY